MSSTMNSPTKSTASRARPGGRTAQKSGQIQAAVLDLLVEGGPESCTFTNVAARSGVERSTLYRRFGNRWAMISDAYSATADRELAIVPTGDFRADMTAHLQHVAASLESTLGRSMVVAAATARLDRTPESGRYWQRRLVHLEPIVDAAVASGQLKPGTDCEQLFGASDGPLFFRLLIVGKPIDAAFVEGIVDDLCARFALPGRKLTVRHKETAS